jgi:hypothetical protein
MSKVICTKEWHRAGADRIAKGLLRRGRNQEEELKSFFRREFKIVAGWPNRL